MRRAARRDWLEESVVRSLEAIGIDVWRVSGAGLPDLLTHSRGKWLPIEVKGPRGKLTHQQAILRQRAQFPIVRSVPEALALFGVVVEQTVRPWEPRKAPKPIQQAGG